MSRAGGRKRGKTVRYHVALEARVLQVEVDGGTARLEGAEGEARVLDEIRGRSLCLSVGGRTHRVFGVRVGEATWEIHHRGRPFRVEVTDERSWRMRRARGDGAAAAAGLEALRAPMPGLVLRVDVEEGQEVAEGQGLVIVEAMKMENELRARVAGRVRRVHVAAGESVRRGDLLIEFEQDAGDGDGQDGREATRVDSSGGSEP